MGRQLAFYMMSYNTRPVQKAGYYQGCCANRNQYYVCLGYNSNTWLASPNLPCCPPWRTCHCCPCYLSWAGMFLKKLQLLMVEATWQKMIVFLAALPLCVLALQWKAPYHLAAGRTGANRALIESPGNVFLLATGALTLRLSPRPVRYSRDVLTSRQTLWLFTSLTL